MLDVHTIPTNILLPISEQGVNSLFWVSKQAAMFNFNFVSLDQLVLVTNECQGWSLVTLVHSKYRGYVPTAYLTPLYCTTCNKPTGNDCNNHTLTEWKMSDLHPREMNLLRQLSAPAASKRVSFLPVEDVKRYNLRQRNKSCSTMEPFQSDLERDPIKRLCQGCLQYPYTQSIEKEDHQTNEFRETNRQASRQITRYVHSFLIDCVRCKSIREMPYNEKWNAREAKSVNEIL